MDNQTVTPPCSCPLAGLCERHKMEKPSHWHELCQKHDSYRQAWDNGIGPGQRKPRPGANRSPQAARQPEKKKSCGKVAAPAMPPLARQVWNLATSLAAFVADGCHVVDAAEYSRRLSICDACELRNGTRCARCGCRLDLKAKGRAFQCPDGRWGRSPVTDLEADTAANAATPPGK